MKPKTKRPLPATKIEPLESRIAPAGLMLNDGKFASVAAGSPLLVSAGEGLSTSDAGGVYLLYVEKGQALVFTTDLNGNNELDVNEITGIAAGDGLSITIFTDVFGDIVTNLKADGTLTDSDNNPGNGRDGQVLANSRIDKIEMRSLVAGDLENQATLDQKIAYSTFSVFGAVMAGKGVGAADGTGGFFIDTTGEEAVRAKYTLNDGFNYPASVIPTLSEIRTGTAASNQPFRFTIDPSGGFSGVLTSFLPPTGQVGGDIAAFEVRGTNRQVNLDGLYAGTGGFGARGGNIGKVVIGQDDHGGYSIIAGDGGIGNAGGAGGSVLDLSDFGSVTGAVIVRAGDGGQGLTGSGGAGGSIGFGTMNLVGNLLVETGSGGDGFTSGGAGASFLSGTFDFADEIDASVGLAVKGTTRSLYSITQDEGVDFNGDGFGDFVWTTDLPDQLVVGLGSGFGNVEEVIYLPATVDPGSLALADFNGDGLTDIAVASSGNSSAPSVRVFMATQDLFGDFAGFSRPFESPLPDLSDDLIGGLFADYLTGTAPITAMVVGDFNADGIYDLAVNAQYSAKLNIGGTITAEPHHLVMVLEGLGNGSFAADFSGAQAPFRDLGKVEDGAPVLRATVLDEAGEDRDVILWAQKGKENIALINYLDGVGMSAPTFFALGEVDTNREVKTPDAENTTKVKAQVGDFDVFDLGGDGIADIVMLASAPSTDVVVLLTYNGMNFEIESGNGADQAGIFIGGDVSLLAVKGVELGGNPGDEVVFYQTADDGVLVREMQFEQPPAGEPNPPGAGGEPFYQLATLNVFAFPDDDGANLVAFDAFIPDLGVPDTVNYALLHPAGEGNENTFLAVVGNAGSDFILYTGDNQVTINTGDGGNSATGSGGAGGSIGAGKLSVADGIASGSLRFDLPDDDIVFAGRISLIAGDGGNGFQSGGNGGSVSGIAANGAEGGGAFASSFGLFGGDGGNGLLGGGGNGGSVSMSSVYAGSDFVGGDGGRGKTGGNGGSVTGNGGLRYDAFYSGSSMRGGDGGNGIKSGGNGGGISGFDVQVTNFVGELIGGSISYFGGRGGNASAGSGGSGGSIADFGPSTEVNKIGGSLEVGAGDGGNGKTGGAGGSIVNFINAPTVSVTPTAFSLIAGTGGRGISGSGGKGGSVSTASVSGDGTAEGFPQFARVLAGDGGKSSGATGGDGGSVTGVIATSQSAPLAIVSGAGGAGLIKGGTGGSVTGTSGNASGLGGDKVLVIAGDGGAANASLPFNHASPLLPPTPLDILKSFGGKNGIGGNGGNIASFTQPTSTQVRVDLIAGNGGNTPYYGTPFDEKVGVGKGGSITNTWITGHIGNPSADAKIGSYNDFEEIGDTANAIRTDSAGNHVVAGSSEDDLFIAKYDNATGALVWASEVLVDVSAGGRDEAFALAIDGADDIVVAGVAGDNLYVRKVSGVDGTLIWEYTYTAPGGESAAADIALDSAGNVLVTGFGVNVAFDEDIYVAKLAAATGLPVWESLIDGPGGGPFDKDDAGRAIAVDSADNAVLTGYVDGDFSDFDGEVIFFDSDLYTAKFDPAGAVVWSIIHDGAGGRADVGNDIAVDSMDHVIVTGFERGGDFSEDVYTVKYDGVGDGFGGTTVIWEAAYDGLASDSGLFFGGSDRGNRLAIDSADNVVVVGATRESFFQGVDIVVLKYAGLDGMPVWADAMDPLLPDPLILSGAGESDDVATSVAIDAADNVFVGGFVVGLGGDTDFISAKADGASGDLIWTQLFNGASSDRINAVTIEPTGDLVVAGDSFRRGGTDVQLIRYATANGAEVWETRFDGEQTVDGVTADFVLAKIRAAGAADSLTDFDGLVGIVVGASGRLLNGLPASSSLNGSLTGLTLQASSFLMSAVAGSVSNIAAIEKISGIVLDGGGVPVPSSLGTDKDPTGLFDYIDTNGMVVSQPTAPSLQAGWGLIDGAIFGREIVGISGSWVFDLP